MENPKIINAGGINGLGKTKIDTSQPDFLDLKAMIQAQSSQQSASQKIENEFLSIRFQMESYVHAETDGVVLAGDFIEKFLKVIQVKKKHFAAYLEYDETNLSALLKGRRKINSDLAIKLGGIFSVNPAIWLNIESKNELIRSEKLKKSSYTRYTLQALLKQVG
jgi:plasmid maintenance system antidote protein VapI